MKSRAERRAKLWSLSLERSAGAGLGGGPLYPNHRRWCAVGPKVPPNLADEFFPFSRRTVDWYHGAESLPTAASLLFPNIPAASTHWLNRAKMQLFQGQAATIAETLTSKLVANQALATPELTAVISYFCNNHQRMQYLEFREDGFPIGSAVLSHSFDRLWLSVFSSPPK